jgi:hypothetical protein
MCSLAAGAIGCDLGLQLRSLANLTHVVINRTYAIVAAIVTYD